MFRREKAQALTPNDSGWSQSLFSATPKALKLDMLTAAFQLAKWQNEDLEIVGLAKN